MIDFHSPTWHRLTDWLQAELAKARAKNDAVGLSEADGNALRGEIRFIKRMLDLPSAVARENAVRPDD